MTSSPKIVTVKNKTVVFPTVCPHCLKLAKVNIGIKSGEQLVGWYFVLTRWKHSAIQVPFCAAFANRMRNLYVSCFFLALGAIAAYLTFVIATGRIVQDNENWIAYLIFIGIFWMPSLIIRPNRHIKMLVSNEEGIQFKVRDSTYAKMLATLNGALPPENEEKKKDNDEDQAFAA